MIRLQLTAEQAETIVDSLNFFEDELWAQYKSEFVENEAPILARIEVVNNLSKSVWEKLHRFNTSVADAVGEGEQTKVDPFDFRGLEF
jgi:hypothetical protein